MQSIIVVIHVLAAVALIGLVLIQHGKGADAGAAFGSGGAGSVFGARGPASFLTRSTAVLATVFFVTSLTLAYFSGQMVERKSVTDQIDATAVEQTVPADTPSAPSDVPSLQAEPAPESTQKDE
ncbi:MAG: preprotein translocase subunit SecG [Pseudomonadota bacterium]